MSRKSVRVKFVGSDDVVEHIVCKTSKTRRKSVGVLMGRVKEEGGGGGGDFGEVVMNEEYLIHRMSRELIDNNNNMTDVIFKTPAKSSRQSLAGDSITPLKSSTKVNFTDNVLERRAREGDVTPRSILKKRSVISDQHTTQTTNVIDSVKRRSCRSVMTPSKTSSSTPSKTSSSTPSKTSSSTPSKTSKTRLETSLSTPSKTSLSRTQSLKTTRTTPSKPSPILPRKTPSRLRKRHDANDSSSSESEIEEEEEEEEDERKKGRSQRRLKQDGGHNGVERHAVEEYFYSHHKTPATTTTSNHTIHNKLEAHQVNSLLHRAAKSTRAQRKSMMQQHIKSFQLYYYYLMQGYNIVLHGLGSKLKFMHSFHHRMLSQYHCVIVNGFFPGLIFKNVISGLLDVLNVECSLPTSGVDQVTLVREACKKRDNPDIFLMINNIDGVNIRHHKHQLSLSLLSLIPHLHIIATIDHINSPLLWDQSKLQRLNWLWFEVSTFETYASETAHENCLMVQQSGNLQLSSLSHIMRSLTANTRGIFQLLCRYQLDNVKNTTYQGLSFSDLYFKCREAFLVNSEPTLRAQLVEFKDHAMIKTKKGVDGVDYVIVSIDNLTLSTFLEQLV